MKKPSEMLLLEVQDTKKANELIASGEWRLERYSERRDAWMLVRRKER